MKREELDAIRKRADKVAKGNPLKDFSILAKTNLVIFEDVPALLAEVERLREALEDIVDHSELYHEWYSWSYAKEALNNGEDI